MARKPLREIESLAEWGIAEKNPTPTGNIHAKGMRKKPPDLRPDAGPASLFGQCKSTFYLPLSLW